MKPVFIVFILLLFVISETTAKIPSTNFFSDIESDFKYLGKIVKIPSTSLKYGKTAFQTSQGAFTDNFRVTRYDRSTPIPYYAPGEGMQSPIRIISSEGSVKTVLTLSSSNAAPPTHFDVFVFTLVVIVCFVL